MKSSEIIEISESLKYLKNELEVDNRLYGDCPDGYVTLDKLIDYCKENEHILVSIIKIAEKVNKLNQQKAV